MPPSKSSPAKKGRITLAQIAGFDDVLTDALVDHVYYWTNIRKNRPSYHPSRGLREADITKIVQAHLIVDPNPELAGKLLLATDGLRKFVNGLKTEHEREHFNHHLRRYMQIYLPDCPFEVTTTNRYTISTLEASLTARRYIKRGETIKYLSGIQVVITPEEEADLAKLNNDFSIVVSSRSKLTNIFMGPARFANHDCGANSKLVTTGNAGIEIHAIRDIDVGEEITVTYSESYFGEDNRECLCATCEDTLNNGWAQGDGQLAVKKSIEEDAQGYSLRRRRRDESVCRAMSETPSVTPDIRPRVRKTALKNTPSFHDQTTLATEGLKPGRPSNLLGKRKLEIESLVSPPITPLKKQKMTHVEVDPVPLSALSRSSSADDVSGSDSIQDSAKDEISTDATTPESDISSPVIHAPKPTIINRAIQVLKDEDSFESRGGSNPLPSVEFAGAEDLDTITPSSQLTFAFPQEAVLVTGAPAASITSSSDSIHVLDSHSAVETTTTVAGETDINHVDSATPEEAPSGLPTPTKRKRGSDSLDEVDDDEHSNKRQRIPGDYVLNPRLLSEPETAWIFCTNCKNPFVQKNAYFTRSSCPRCERHSMLYGYIWPKTMPEGKRDKEERILDHRTVNRFLHRGDELKIRGRKVPEAPLRATTPAESLTPSPPKKKIVNKAVAKRRKSRADSEGDDEEDGDFRPRPGTCSVEPRKSGRARRASAKVVMAL